MIDALGVIVLTGLADLVRALLVVGVDGAVLLMVAPGSVLASDGAVSVMASVCAVLMVASSSAVDSADMILLAGRITSSAAASVCNAFLYVHRSTW